MTLPQLSLSLLFVAMIALFFAARELYCLILRMRSKRVFRARREALFHVNPRLGRRVIYQTVHGNLKRLTQSIFTTKPWVEQAIKDICEAQSIGNDTDFVNTFEVANVVSSKRWQMGFYSHVTRLIKRIYAPVRILTEMSRKVSTAAKRAVKRARHILLILRNALIKFVHNSGGMTDNDEDHQNSARNEV